MTSLMPTSIRVLMALALALLGTLGLTPAEAAKPLRVLLLGPAPTSAAGEAGRFTTDWASLLEERGAAAAGKSQFPTAEELKAADVLVFAGPLATALSAEERQSLERFQRGGGGLVLLNNGLGGNDPAWVKSVAGAARKAKGTNAPVQRIGLYFTDYRHPITAGLSNFDLDDTMERALDLAPEAQVIATSFHTAKEILPQMWTFEKRRGRVFGSAQGLNPATLRLPHFRGVVLRAIAWAGRRDIDSLARPTELDQFRYPAGGPTAPEQSLAKIRVNPEFSLSLVAAEPMVVNPISIDWDPQGRLWVAITPEYPFKEGKGKGRDELLILEDTDHDGRMDRRSVFADGLVLPTSFVFSRDGVIVAQAPEILFLRDRNGDGKADRREVLFSGFGTFDTHAVINNLRWGLDGWVYGCQGYSGNDSTNIVNARGRKFGKIGNGIFRFKPDGSAIEQVSSYGGNSWGIDFSDEGELFFSKANGPHINHVVMPERYLALGNLGKTASDKSIEDHQKVNPIFTDPRHEYVQVAPVGVFTAASGCTIYQGGVWPEKYHGSHFVCEPTVHIVHEDVINRAESPSFEATLRDTDEFIAGRDLWFRPVHTRVGPDGQMYLLDFYNQAISHNDIRGVAHGKGNAAVRPDRDHLHGRIYRITNNQHRRQPAWELNPARPEALVAALAHPNMWVRMNAQRLLAEGPAAAAPAVPSLVTLLRTNRSVHARLHALWTLHQLDALAETNLLAGLKDEHPSVLLNALRVTADLRSPPSSNVTAAVIKQLKGNTERIRLEALFTLASSEPSPETITAVHKLFPDLKDGWTKSTVLGIARQAPTNFIRAAFASDKADSYTELVQILTTDFLERKDAGRAEWVLRHTARQTKVSSKLRVAVLEAFNKRLPDYQIPFSTNVDAAITGLLDTDSKSTRIALFPLAMHYEKQGTYGPELAKVRDSLLAELENPKAKDEERNTLLTSLLKVPALQPSILRKVDAILFKGAPDPVQIHMVNELGALRDPAVGPVLLHSFAKLKPEARTIAFAHIIKRPEWTDALLKGLEAETIKLADLGVLGTSRLRTHPDKEVARRSAALLDRLEGPRVKEKNAIIARFEAALKDAPDIANGREMFIRNCTICHKFNEKGRQIGPELTGVGLHGGSVLLTHIIDPNRVVEGNFIAYNLTTTKGDDYSGLIKTENKEAVTLRNLEGEVTVKRTEIASLTSSGLSLMPEGLEALGEKNIRDIIGYITSKNPKGFRPIPLDGAYTASSLRGLYASQDEAPSLAFKQFGLVMVDAIPFDIASPAAMPGGRNVIVLKGGSGFAKTLPRRVEFKVGTPAKKLFFLGGVAGWGFPYGPPEGHNVPAAKATLTYEDGQTEEITWKNGEEFADYVRPQNVPGSKPVADLTTSGQLRWFSAEPKRRSPIARIALESFDNHLAPTFISVTAQVD